MPSLATQPLARPPQYHAATKRVPRPPSVIAWEGPSPVTGERIALVLTGLGSASSNPKTGGMVQGWIVPSTRAPRAAIDDDKGAAVCGACPVQSACYAQRGTSLMALSSVGRAMGRDSYPRVTIREASRLLAGKRLRFGAYGDPAMLPLAVVRALAYASDGWTGYTHQWRTCDPRFSDLLMASVETPDGAALAQSKGYRTFRVRPSLASPVLPSEFTCPASSEAGHRTTCAKCGLCNGSASRARSVVIVAHGSGASLYSEAA